MKKSELKQLIKEVKQELTEVNFNSSAFSEYPNLKNYKKELELCISYFFGNQIQDEWLSIIYNSDFKRLNNFFKELGLKNKKFFNILNTVHSNISHSAYETFDDLYLFMDDYGVSIADDQEKYTKWLTKYFDGYKIWDILVKFKK